MKYLKNVADISIEPTAGEEVFAFASTVFGQIDRSFYDWNTHSITPTKTRTQKVGVFEQIEDGCFEQVYSDFAPKRLSDLCLSQSQCIQFVRNHRSLLRDGGYATFFLFEVGGTFYVAGVYRRGVLAVDIRLYNDNTMWFGEMRRRYVVPA